MPTARLYGKKSTKPPFFKSLKLSSAPGNIKVRIS